MASSSASRPPVWATRANALTALRFAAAPALVYALVAGATHLAAALFAVAVTTDLLDGPVARRFGETSALGGLLDHATDALFVSSGLAALAWLGEVPWPLPALVATAFAQYALDSGALTAPRNEVLSDRAVHGSPAPRAPRALRTSALGRFNGIAYYVMVGIPVVRDALGLVGPATSWVYGLGTLLVATTLVSMADRAHAQRRARGSAAPGSSP